MALEVLIKAEVLRGQWTGVQYYTAQLIEALAGLDDLALTVHCKHDEALALVRRGVGDRARCQKTIGGLRDFCLPRADLRDFDVIHCPTAIAPFRRRPGRDRPKLVMTFHDLIPLAAPELHARRYRVYFRYVLPRLLGMFDAFIAVSEATRRDVVRFYGIDESRIHVIPPASRWAVPDEPPTAPRERFVLAVGTLEKRKNLSRVIRAFVQLRERAPGLADRLLIAGSPGFAVPEDRRLLEQHKDVIQWLGYVEEDALRDLYRRAAVLVCPSLYEGFGLPVLEAMTFGCPVITSNRSSLPEVAGDAAVLVDPESVDEIASAMQRLLEDAPLALELSAKSLARARQFSWIQCARATRQVYETIL